MKNLKLPVFTATAFLCTYAFIGFFESLESLFFFMFSISPIVVIWMVVRILKDGVLSSYTFDEKLYEDYDENRLRVE